MTNQAIQNIQKIATELTTIKMKNYCEALSSCIGYDCTCKEDHMEGYIFEVEQGLIKLIQEIKTLQKSQCIDMKVEPTTEKLNELFAFINNPENLL